MDAFIDSAMALCERLIPILEAIALVALIVLLVWLSKLIKTLVETFKKTHTTIALVDQSIEKAQAPLDSVVKLSKSVDKTHDAALKAVGDAKEYIVKNADNIKEKINSFKKQEEVKEPSPEDIIGGN